MVEKALTTGYRVCVSVIVCVDGLGFSVWV